VLRAGSLKPAIAAEAKRYAVMGSAHAAHSAPMLDLSARQVINSAEEHSHEDILSRWRRESVLWRLRLGN